MSGIWTAVLWILPSDWKLSLFWLLWNWDPCSLHKENQPFGREQKHFLGYDSESRLSIQQSLFFFFFSEELSCCEVGSNPIDTRGTNAEVGFQHLFIHVNEKDLICLMPVWMTLSRRIYLGQDTDKHCFLRNFISVCSRFCCLLPVWLSVGCLDLPCLRDPPAGEPSRLSYLDTSRSWCKAAG